MQFILNMLRYWVQNTYANSNRLSFNKVNLNLFSIALQSS
jgi:hypothetical protein